MYIVGRNFEWDPDKARNNLRRHGVSFERAQLVFETPDQCLEMYDDANAHIEDRFITLGPCGDRTMVVVWTERETSAIRIISARWATPREHRSYLGAMAQYRR